jgi:hypothetical protein
MTPRIKALLTLVCCAPILTEIVSGNTPAHSLLDPRIVFFLLLAYSWPLLVIREMALRWRLSTGGIFTLGIAYGVWNEGLLAQTLMRYEHVPINQFDHYLYAGGFNLSWAALIVPWHALLAVVLPLALVGRLFPLCAEEHWLGKRTLAVLAAMLVAALIFVSVVRKPHAQMLACLFAIAACVMLSSVLPRGHGLRLTKDSRRAFPFAFGAVAYPVFIVGAIVLAANRVTPLTYFAVVIAVFAALARLSVHYRLLMIPAAARLALGVYFAASVFNMAVGIAHRSPEQILTGAVLAAVFIGVAFIGLRGSGTLAADGLQLSPSAR